MQTDQNAKQQIVEKIKNTTNILVTVGTNPSVDELSAALGLTLMLNRLDKHATAVFSGQIPPAINFLEPSKTFENTVDSLRDFIIALDKEKADRLRYKVEDNIVRIFITPYKTVISEKDLQFSQGDFNVETIIALGVEKREDLDTAITAHGRILHDAAVITVNTGRAESSLGSIDWTDDAASSLCEMLMSLSEALQSGLLDQQIATALLTGIVAATDRFRNEHTSPRVMTMAAQLMAAGANQQLIAAKLEEGHELPAADGTTPLNEGRSQKVTSNDSDAAPGAPADGSLQINHEPAAPIPPPADPGADALKEAEDELAKSLAASTPATPTLSVDDMQQDLAAAAAEVGGETTPVKAELEAPQPAVSDEATAAGLPPLPSTAPRDEHPKIIKQERSWRTQPVSEPTFGGTLSATTEEAEEAKREEESAGVNRQILSHDHLGAPAQSDQPTDASAPVSGPAPEPSAAPTSPIPTFEPASPVDEAKPLESTDDTALSFEPAPITPVEQPTLAELEEQTRGKAAEEARAAVDAALSAMPFDPSGQPVQSAGATPVFELSHEESTPAPAPVVPAESPAEPTMTPPPLPPLPDFSTLPPLPGEAPEAGIQPPVPSEAPASSDPGQFRIPGQN